MYIIKLKSIHAYAYVCAHVHYVFVCLCVDPGEKTPKGHHLIHLAAMTDGTDTEFRSLLAKVKSRLK